MELSTIKLQTTWNDAAECINRNNLKIATELTKLGASTYKNKGYFSSSNALITAYPSASDGCIAYVGTSYPYTIYVWSKAANTWVNSGQTGGDVNVELGDYYTKQETHDAIKDEYEVLPQEAYDALDSKEEKLYFCYEE